jgi:FecR protein
MQPLSTLVRVLGSSIFAMALGFPTAGLSSRPVLAAELTSGATLSILSAGVEIAPTADGPFVPAIQGQLVQAGDVVRTAQDGAALLTFFDGSESQIAGNSQLQVQRADYAPAPRIALFQSAGVSVNRVIPLPTGGSFETNTPTAIGLVRGTSYVVSVSPTGPSMPRVEPAPDAPEQIETPVEQDQFVGDQAPKDLEQEQEQDQEHEMDMDAAAVADMQSIATDSVSSPDVPVETAMLNPDGAVEAGSTTSIVLLTDRDGHVGHVQVVASASRSTVDLTSAGDLGATSGQQTAQGHLASETLMHFESAARDFHDVAALRQVAVASNDILRAVEPAVARSAVAQETVTGAPVVVGELAAHVPALQNAAAAVSPATPASPTTAVESTTGATAASSTALGAAATRASGAPPAAVNSNAAPTSQATSASASAAGKSKSDAKSITTPVAASTSATLSTDTATGSAANPVASTAANGNGIGNANGNGVSAPATDASNPANGNANGHAASTPAAQTGAANGNGIANGNTSNTPAAAADTSSTPAAGGAASSGAANGNGAANANANASGNGNANGAANGNASANANANVSTTPSSSVSQSDAAPASPSSSATAPTTSTPANANANPNGTANANGNAVAHANGQPNGQANGHTSN